MNDASPLQLRALMIDLSLRVVVDGQRIDATLSGAALTKQLGLNDKGDCDLRLPLPVSLVNHRHSHGMRIAIPADATQPQPPTAD